MKTLSQRLDEYLALRRSMGFDLSFEERVLRKFTTYAGENGFNRISTPLFLDWKANYGSADNNTWSHRLGMVRRFAFWLAEHDNRTEVPSSQLVTGRYLWPPCRIVADPVRLDRGDGDARERSFVFGSA